MKLAGRFKKRLSGRRILLAFALSLLSVGVARPAHAVTQDPILVVGGYAADTTKLGSFQTWLQLQGFNSYTMVLSQQYPGTPTGSAAIATSAQAIADEVSTILQQTGASKVDIVAHSEGGLAERYYVKYLGGTSYVRTYVDVGTPEDGDSAAEWCSLFQGCQDMLPGSAFLNQLNTDPPIPAGLPAYHFYSTNGTGELNPLPGAWNGSVQSFCPGRSVDHANELTDGAMQQLIASALNGGPLSTTCP